MRQKGLLVLAALMLGAPVGALTQPASTQAPQIPPDALVPNAEMQAVFEALSQHPLTDELLAGTMQSVPGGSAAPMDDVIEPFFARGERVTDWDAAGVDLDAIVARRPGGAGGNMLRGTSQAGPMYSYLEDRPIEALIPREWVLVGQRGALVTGGSINVEIGRLSPKVILAERVSYRRHGNATCRTGAESRLYADPSVPASELDGITVIMAMRQLARAARSPICEVIEEAGPARYRVRLFDAEGYRLPRLERNMPYWEIVPLAPFPTR